MKLVIPILIAFVLVSCYNQKHNVNVTEFDKISNVHNLSFFGNIAVDSVKITKKGSGQISLIFKEGALKYVGINGRKGKSYEQLFKISKPNDTLNMLTGQFTARYFTTDTLLFSRRVCFEKRDYFNTFGVIDSVPFLTELRIYEFFERECIYREKRIYDQEERTGSNQVVASYLEGTQRMISFDTSYIVKEYSDRKMAQFEFFRKRYAH